MRSLFPAAQAFALTMICGGAFGGADAVRPGPAVTPAAAASTTADNEAAARHAKRTACLQTAKTKKLAGAQKAGFIKECSAAP